MDRSQIPPLRTLNLRPRPIGTQPLAWSADGELAVATDDGIHVYIPEYPSVRRPGDPAATLRDQYALSLQVSSRIRPIAEVNRQLFVFRGIDSPAQDAGQAELFLGVGNSLVVGQGSGMFQVVRVEWSPPGVGCNLRPVLTCMLTTGQLITLGEAADHASTTAASSKSRSFKEWKILWGLGGLIPLPDDEEPEGYRVMDERVTSFSWARHLDSGRGLLAYMNDQADVVIMSAQLCSPKTANTGQQEGWDIREIARFRGSSPHTGTATILDPDFVPFRSAFALKWSPWVTDGDTKTSTLAYLTRNHVGFRRVTVIGSWELGSPPDLQVESHDTVSICLFLAADAFVEWEDMIWDGPGNLATARGFVASPFELHPFEVALTGPLEEPLAPHVTSDCSTTYSDQDGSTNPITGIVVHPPDASSKPELPFFTSIRLSATGENQDWYNTNLPQEGSVIPSWVKRIHKATSKLVSRAEMFGQVDDDSDSDDLQEDEGEEVAKMQKHPLRFRIWGIAASPGGLSTAIVVSKHSTQFPTRQGACSVYFDRDTTTTGLPDRIMSTEGKMWEWMYTEGPDVTGVTTPSEVKPESSGVGDSELRRLFAGVLAKQLCEFCDGHLKPVGDSIWCDNGHTWGVCAATGLAIMRPGTSRVCTVCGLRCLKLGQLQALATTYLGPEVTVPVSDSVCGGCGGKFLI